MSSQTIYFTDPSVITGIQSEVTDIKTSQMSTLIGKFRTTWAGAGPFYVVGTGTFGNETWKYPGRDKENTRYTTGFFNPAATPFTIRGFKKSVSIALPFETPGSNNHLYAIDEQYLYAIIHNRPSLPSDFDSMSELLATLAIFDSIPIFDVSANGPYVQYSWIVKYDKFSLKQIAMVPLFSYRSTAGILGRYKGTRGPLCLSNDHIYLTAGWAASDNPGVLKIKKSDLSLVWSWEPAAEINQRPYFKWGALLTAAYFYEATTGARTNDVVVVSSQCEWQYTQVWGTNLIASNIPGNNSAYSGNSEFDLLKLSVDWQTDSGYMWCLNDYGTSVTQRWQFASAPEKLVAGNLFTSDSVIPGSSVTYIYNTLWSTGTDGLKFQQYTGSNYFDTKGLGYTGTDSAVHNGHWLFTNYTGYVVDPLVTANPLGTLGDNKVAFFDFLDGGVNQSQLLPGNKFSVTGTYRGYRMTGTQLFIDPFATHQIKGQNLWTTNPTLSFIPDLGQPVDVKGSVLLGQPITKRIYSDAVNNMVLDKYDAYSLNFYGGSNYGSWCYDAVNDNIIFGTSNGNLCPLDEIIANRDTPYNSGVAGCQIDDIVDGYTYITTYNANRTPSNATGYVNFYEEFKTKANARLNRPRSPRSNRWLCASVISMTLATGQVNWTHKLVSYDGYDWNYWFNNSVFGFFFDAGFNCDVQSVHMINNPTVLQTKGGRMVAISSKDKVCFFDPDGVVERPISSVTANANHGTDSLMYKYGISTTSGLMPKGPVIAEFWNQQGCNGFFVFNQGATNGSKYIAQLPTCSLWNQVYGTTNTGEGTNPIIYDPATKTYITARASSCVLAIYDLASTKGTSPAYVSGSNPAGTGSMPTLERIIALDPELGTYSSGIRGGLTLYGNTVLLTHNSTLLGFDITTGKEVFREVVPWCAWNPPIVTNDVMYVEQARKAIFPAINTTINGYGNNFLMLMSPQGL